MSHHEYAEYLRSTGLAGGVTIPLKQRPDRLGAMTLLSVSQVSLTPDALKAADVLAHMAMARASTLSDQVSYEPVDRRQLRLLSPRQMEILRWVAQGKTNREIALIMGSTRRTIDYHLQEILTKLGVSSRTQAAMVLAAAEV